MKTVIKVDLFFVLLLSIFILSSYGADFRRSRRGIGEAIIKGIVNTQKAFIHGITDTVGAAVEAGKKSRNATETPTKSLDLMEDDYNTGAESDHQTLTAGEMASNGENNYDDEVEVSDDEEAVVDNLMFSDKVAFSGDVETYPEDEGSGSDLNNDDALGDIFNGEETLGEGTSDNGMPTFDDTVVTYSGEMKSTYNGLQSGSEGHLGDLEREVYNNHRKVHLRRDDSHEDYSREDYSHENDRFKGRRNKDKDNYDKKRKYHSNERFSDCDDDDSRDDDDCRRRRNHLYDDSREHNYSGQRHSQRRIPGRSRRSIGSLHLFKSGLIGSNRAVKTRSSEIDNAVVGETSNTTNTVGEGVKDTIDAAKETVNTTTLKPEENKTSSNSTCKSNDLCFVDSDCGGGKCVGPFTGTCNCNSCFNYMTCTNDKGCGGLRGACDLTINRCLCQEGHRKAGFPNFVDTLTKFCNIQSCNATSDSCNGLPCNSGRCFC